MAPLASHSWRSRPSALPQHGAPLSRVSSPPPLVGTPSFRSCWARSVSPCLQHTSNDRPPAAVGNVFAIWTTLGFKFRKGTIAHHSQLWGPRVDAHMHCIWKHDRCAVLKCNIPPVALAVRLGIHNRHQYWSKLPSVDFLDPCCCTCGDGGTWSLQVGMPREMCEHTASRGDGRAINHLRVLHLVETSSGAIACGSAVRIRTTGLQGRGKHTQGF